MFPLSRLRERVGVRASLNQRFKNAFQHRLGSLQRLIIPEPNHPKPATREVSRAFEIVDRRIHMLSSIQLDDQPRPNANEIHDVPPDRHLTPESVSAQASMPQGVPETPLGVG
jgi:hypothetical protein